MSSKRHKILVLSDLKESTEKTLMCAVDLAKIIDGDISLFHVTKPSDVVDRESQLSAVRTINEKSSATKKQIEMVVKSVIDSSEATIKYEFSFGNVKHEIEQYILKNRPDVIVLGKRKPRVVNLIGDNLTDYILKTHQGSVLIAGSENVLKSEQKITLGVLNENGSFDKISYANKLKAQAIKPLKSFKFVKQSDSLPTYSTNSENDIVEYVFEYNDQTLQSVANYLQKNNLNLLLVDRNTKNQNLNQADINEIIGKTNISLLISNL